MLITICSFVRLSYHRLWEYCCYCKQINRTSTNASDNGASLCIQCIIHFPFVAFFSTKFQVRYGKERTERERKKIWANESKGRPLNIIGKTHLHTKHFTHSNCSCLVAPPQSPSPHFILFDGHSTLILLHRIEMNKNKKNQSEAKRTRRTEKKERPEWVRWKDLVRLPHQMKSKTGNERAKKKTVLERTLCNTEKKKNADKM